MKNRKALTARLPEGSLEVLKKVQISIAWKKRERGEW